MLTFSEKIKEVRLSKVNERGKPFSQENSARLFDVSLSTWRNWEQNRSLPDYRSRKQLQDKWPELFS